jgi:Tfp pilus assembly protein PilF
MASRRESLEALIAQDPGNSRLRFMLGMEHLSGSEFADAVRVFGELTASDPDYVVGYFQAGRASESLEQEDAARDWYRKGIDAARRTGDTHALSELQGALDLLGG